MILSINQAFELNNLIYELLETKYSFDKKLLKSFKSHASLLDLINLKNHLENKVDLIIENSNN